MICVGILLLSVKVIICSFTLLTFIIKQCNTLQLPIYNSMDYDEIFIPLKENEHIIF